MDHFDEMNENGWDFEDYEDYEDDAQRVVLCGANSYTQKYYLGDQFSNLPEAVKQELQIICVLYVEDVGGILTMEFNEDGDLELRVAHDPLDYLFDDIGSELKIRQIQKEKRELMEQLETYYRIMFLEQN